MMIFPGALTGEGHGSFLAGRYGRAGVCLVWSCRRGNCNFGVMDACWWCSFERSWVAIFFERGLGGGKRWAN